jgi:hypothetical protein
MIIVYLYIIFSVLYMLGVVRELKIPIWMYFIVIPFSPIILPIRLGAQNEQSQNK